MKLNFLQSLFSIHIGGKRTPVGKNEDIYLVRDWAYLGGGILVGSFLALGLSFYSFSIVRFGGGSGEEILGQSPRTLSRAQLDSVIKKYQDKEEAFVRLKSQKPIVPKL